MSKCVNIKIMYTYIYMCVRARAYNLKLYCIIIIVRNWWHEFCLQFKCPGFAGVELMWSWLHIWLKMLHLWRRYYWYSLSSTFLGNLIGSWNYSGKKVATHLSTKPSPGSGEIRIRYWGSKIYYHSFIFRICLVRNLVCYENLKW